MNVNISHGRVTVMWTDDGRPCELITQGTRVLVDNEQTLRELYEALGFLYDKPATRAPRP